MSVFINGKIITAKPYTIINHQQILPGNSKIVVHGKQNNLLAAPYGIAFSKDGGWAVVDYEFNCVLLYDSQDVLVKRFAVVF